MQRRQFIIAAAAVVASGCDKRTTSKPTPTAPAQSGPNATKDAGPWSEIPFPKSGEHDEQLASLLAIADAPLLVALHGRGEAGRGLRVGARGWRRDYRLDLASDRLFRAPLTTADFHEFVTPARLKQLNQSLAARPYEGLSVACPYTPIVRPRTVAGAQRFARFLEQRLLPAVRKVSNAPAVAKSTGIDGVSMGGRLALLVGLSHPQTYGSVGALQPAIGVKEAAELAELAARAHEKHGTKLRLVSSLDDPFLDAVEALAEAMSKRNIPHQLVVTPGPHDYVYNRGPGAYEMLLWHERVLRGHQLPAAAKAS